MKRRGLICVKREGEAELVGPSFRTPFLMIELKYSRVAACSARTGRVLRKASKYWVQFSAEVSTLVSSKYESRSVRKLVRSLTRKVQTDASRHASKDESQLTKYNIAKISCLRLNDVVHS